jgi:hypothetical protein
MILPNLCQPRQGAIGLATISIAPKHEIYSITRLRENFWVSRPGVGPHFLGTRAISGYPHLVYM